MDAVNLQGIWPTFPGNTVRVRYAVALYNRLLQDAVDRERKTGKKKETPLQRQRRLLDEVIARITEEEHDDAFVILTL